MKIDPALVAVVTAAAAVGMAVAVVAAAATAVAVVTAAVAVVATAAVVVAAEAVALAVAATAVVAVTNLTTLDPTANTSAPVHAMCSHRAHLFFANRRKSPSRCVRPVRSKYSQIGTAYFRDVPKRSRISATVAPRPSSK